MTRKADTSQAVLGQETMYGIWIARDKSGVLCAFRKKPERDKRSRIWRTQEERDCSYCCIEELWFPDLKWEDKPIELTIKKEKQL